MDIIDEVIHVVSEALRQGYFVPGVSLNDQAYREFLSLCTVDHKPAKCKIHVRYGRHPQRIQALLAIPVSY